MNYRDLVNKLEAIERGETISEAITIKNVMAAVQGKTDEQERAGILNDLAWKENLPGLYDPVSGYFVAKQSQQTGAMGSNQGYSISNSGSKDADAQLAQLGLIPKNAQTSSALGKFFGTSGDMYDKGVRTSNDAIVAQQEKAELIKTSMAKLAELLKKLQEVVAQEAKFNAAVDARVKSQQGQGAKAATPPKPVTEGFSKTLVESFGYESIEEEQTEEGFGAAAGKLLGRAAPGAGAVLGGMEAADRWKDGDYLGAGLAGLSGAFSLVPGIGWIPAVGLAAINMGRDAAKSKAEPQAGQGAAPAGKNLGIAQMQKELGVAADGIIGPITTAAMAKNPKLAAKYGFGPDGKPLPKQENFQETKQMKSAAEQYRDLVNKLELLESDPAPQMVDADTGNSNSSVNPNIVPAEVAAQAKPANPQDEQLAAQIEKAGGKYELVDGKKYILVPTPGNEGKPTVVKADTMEIVDGTKQGLPPTGEIFDPSQLSEAYGLDEGLWDSIFKGAINLGRNVANQGRSFASGVKGGGSTVYQNAKTGRFAGGAKTANAAGKQVGAATQFAKANPIKTGLGVGGLGYTAGSLAGGPDAPASSSSSAGQSSSTGQSGSGQGAAAAATPEAPTASPEVQSIVDEIRKLMNDMAKIDDPTVKDAIGKATQQIDAIPGVKKAA